MAGLLGYLGVVLVHDACCRQSISQHEPVHKAQRPESGRKLKSSWRSEATQHNLEARGMTWPYCFSTSLLTHILRSWASWASRDAFQKELVAMDVCSEGPLEWSPGMLCRIPLSSSPSSQGSEAAEVNPSQTPLRLSVIMEWNVAVRHGWIETPLSKQDGSWDVTETTSHCSLQREISCVQVR